MGIKYNANYRGVGGSDQKGTGGQGWKVKLQENLGSKGHHHTECREPVYPAAAAADPALQPQQLPAVCQRLL